VNTEQSAAQDSTLQAPLAANLNWAQFLAVSVCALGLGADLLDMSLGNALAAVFSAPPYQLSGLSLGWILSGVYLGAVVGSPVLGWAAQRMGLQRMLRWLLLGLAVTAALCAASPSPNWLGIGRILSGLVLGPYPPVMIAYLSQILPPRRRGTLIFAASGVAYLAPPAGVFLVRSLSGSAPLGLDSWRWPFAASAALALCVAAAAHWLAPISPAQPSHRDCATAAVPVGQQRTRFALAAALYFLSPWATVAFPLLTGPILLHRGLSLQDSLLHVGLATFGPIIGTFTLGPLMDRVARRTSLVLFAVMMLVTAVGFITLPFPAVTTIAVVMFSTGVALYTPALTVYGAELFPYRSRAASTSAAWALNRLAACLAPIVLIGVCGSSATVLTASVCSALIASILLARTGPAGSMGKALD
jgi:MFS transporter, putative metabolite:H+ symporter